MVDSGTNLQNLHDAANMSAIALGLAGPVSGWSQDEKLAYLGVFANTIVTNPGLFTDQSVRSAQIVLGQNFDGMTLDDFINAYPGQNGASLAKVFVDEFGERVLGTGAAVSRVGDAAINVVSKLASAASNTGDAADRLTRAAAQAAGTPGFSGLLTVAAVGIVALLVFSATRKAERAFS